jgi:hypothetical protein
MKVKALLYLPYNIDAMALMESNTEIINSNDFQPSLEAEAADTQYLFDARRCAISSLPSTTIRNALLPLVSIFCFHVRDHMTYEAGSVLN